MKTFYIFILLNSLILTKITFSQNQYSISNKIDTLDIDFRKLLDLEFTRISTGQSSNFGTFAKISTEDDIVTLAGNIKVGDKSNLAITTRGGVTEGIVPLINGGVTSPKISFALQYNLGLYNLRKFTYVDGTKLLNLKYSLDSLNSTEIESEFKIDMLPKKNALKISKTDLKIKNKKEKRIID